MSKTRSASPLDDLQAHFQPKVGLREYCEATLTFKLHEWQHKHLIPLLERCVTERGLRVAIHKPPQFGGSIIVSNRFPAWVLGRDPLHRVALACYNVTHASTFGEQVRNQMRSEEYAKFFPKGALLERDDVGSEAFKTAARAALVESQFSFRAVGLLSGMVGHGADTLIIDDPYASADDAKSESINERVWRFWVDTVNTRIPETTNVIVMFHRYHEDDFAGRLLSTKTFESYRFPAIADENEDRDDPTGRAVGEILSPIRTREYLDSIRESNPQTWLGQFQGRPRPPEGAFIHRDWIKKEESHPKITRWVRFWDLATKADKKSDFTAGALVGMDNNQTIWIKDIVRFRAEWPDASEIICRVTAEDKEWCDLGCGYSKHLGEFDGDPITVTYHVGVEKVAWQRPMIQDLFRKAIFSEGKDKVSLWPVKPEGDKKERASGWTTRAKYDMLRIVTGKWNQDFINECVAFDGLGLTHDDQIDAVSGAYELLWDTKGEHTDERIPAAGSIEYFRKIRQNHKEGIKPATDSEGWD